MFRLVSRIINLGVDPRGGTHAFKVKITNIAALIACVVPILFGLYYYFYLQAPVPAAVNALFVLIYASSLVMAHFQFYYASKLWLFIAVMVHTFLLATYIFTPASGFHYFYLLLPSCLFLLFDEHEKLEKPIIMAIGFILFFYCENTVVSEPLVVLSATSEKLIFSSTLTIVLLEIYLVTYVFSRSISRNEMLLQDMAAKDSLTGLNNRRTFVEIGQTLITGAKRYDKPLTLLIMDVDHFKRINDVHGHIAGDTVLQKLSYELQKAIRASDLLARYGGEEFVIMLPETTEADGIELANTLRNCIEELQVKIENEGHLSCTVSIGVASLTPEVETLNQLTHRADTALYQAKSSGRNCVQAFKADA